MPIVFLKCSTTAPIFSAVVTSKPVAYMWQESRHTPMRLSPPARSISSRSSSNDRPRVLPAPAVFSKRRRHPSDSASSEERRVGKECRSRCDWSSDVCSSDLAGQVDQLAQLLERSAQGVAGAGGVLQKEAAPVGLGELGRASCRERV